MIDWIKKTIDPPGIEKPNRLAIFSVIGEVMSRVRKDAEKAFYAHFPYLADDKKLNEHGEALLIPHLPNDTPEEYRNRVATASFFLMKAGERAYIMEQLRERFGDRFLVIEKFLSIHTKVTEITDDERAWVWNLFDSLVDPNIFLELSEWYHYLERVITDDKFAISKIVKNISDSFLDAGVKFDGTIKHDGKHTAGKPIADRFTVLLRPDNFIDVFETPLRHNGMIKTDGSHKFNGSGRISDLPVNIKSRLKFQETVILTDSFVMKIQENNKDYFPTRFKFDGTFRHNGEIYASGSSEELKLSTNVSDVREELTMNEGFFIGMKSHHKHDGSFKANGEIKFNSGILVPV